MAQDIRELLKQDREPDIGKIPAGHRERFKARLEKSLPQTRNSISFIWLKIAAVLVVMVGVGYFFWSQERIPLDNPIVDLPIEEREELTEAETERGVTLADLSPEYKKVEEYYLTNLNLGIAKINITAENKSLIDAFMVQLAQLDKEYARLNKEIGEIGPNEETIEALITNLQLRLDLLFKLKNKLNELKNESNENFEKNQA